MKSQIVPLSSFGNAGEKHLERLYMLHFCDNQAEVSATGSWSKSVEIELHRTFVVLPAHDEDGPSGRRQIILWMGSCPLCQQIFFAADNR